MLTASPSRAKPMPVRSTLTVPARTVTTLSHYTNLAGLHGILEGSAVRASNVAFLNDREELLHGLKCAQDALAKMVGDAKLKPWKPAIEKVGGEIEDGRLPNTYAACFCERSDLLSQWRGYGGRDQGICLVFDREGLERMNAHATSFLAPVQYGLVKGKSAMRESLQTRLLSIDANEFVAMSAEAKRRKVFDLISELIPRFKHKGFENELEWRLVVQHAELPEGLRFRPAGNILVPYIEIPAARLPLKYVRVGPGHDVELTRRSVEMFLEAKGYDDVPVRSSSVPFRG